MNFSEGWGEGERTQSLYIICIYILAPEVAKEVNLCPILSTSSNGGDHVVVILLPM